MANDRCVPTCVGDEVLLKVRYAAASDSGRIRKNNEDAFLADPAIGIFAVADGMGGHAAGIRGGGVTDFQEYLISNAGRDAAIIRHARSELG